MLLALHPLAEQELQQAIDRLEAERPGYGARLLAAVRSRIEQAAEFPQSGSAVSGLANRYDARSYRVRRFRYRVITVRLNERTVVIAVAHTSRDPNYWRDRLR